MAVKVVQTLILKENLTEKLWHSAPGGHIPGNRAGQGQRIERLQFPEAEHLREVERVFLLRVIDAKWMDHIDDMDQLRQGIGLQAYGQRDPLVEYKSLCLRLFL